MEKEYVIEVREILSRNVPVKAASYDEALRTVKKMYRDEKIVLDYSDLESTYFFSTTKKTEKEVAAL